MFLKKSAKFAICAAFLTVALCICAFAASVTITFMNGEDVYKTRSVEAGTTLMIGEDLYRDEAGNLTSSSTAQGITEYVVGWKAEDGTIHNYNLLAPQESMTLTAVWKPIPQTEAAPGVNLFGSVEECFNLRASNGNVSIVQDETKGSVVKYVRGSSYASVQVPVKWELGRKYRLTGAVRTDIDGNNATVNYNPRYNTTTAPTGVGNHPIGLVAQNGTTWVSFSKDFTFDSTLKDDTVNYISNYAANFISLYGNPYNGAAYVMYFADLSLVPYYQVKFDANGGTGAPATIHTLENSVDVSAVAVPTKAAHTFLGWTTTPGSTDYVTNVSLAEGDVTLYANWVKTDPNSIIVTLMDGDSVFGTNSTTAGGSVSLGGELFKTGTVVFHGEGKTGAEKYLIGWKAEGGKELHNGIIYPTEDITLYAVWGDVPTTPLTPGVNALGSLDGYYNLRPSGGYLEVVKDSTLNKDVVKYVRYGNGYQSVQLPVVWEEGRKYKITGKARNDIDGNNITINYNPRYYTTSVTTGAGDHPKHLVTQSGKTWVSFDVDYTFTETAYVSNYYANFLSIYPNPYNNTAYDVYFSDLSFVPYYKVSFDANGGTGAPEAIQTLESSVDISGVGDPARAGYIFKGWGTSSGTTKAVTSVTLDGEDVTLYAIWEATDAQSAVSYRFVSEKRGDAQGTITLVTTMETADYTSATVYYADDEEVLSDYLALCTLDITSGAASYVMPQGRAFPENATRLCAIYSAEGKPDIRYWYTIPETKKRAVETPKMTIYAVSDMHYGRNVDYWPEMTVNRNNAFADIIANDPDLVFVVGDLVSYADDADHFTALREYFVEKLDANGIPAFVTVGNHEYYNRQSQQKDYLEQPFLDFMTAQLAETSKYGYTIERDPTQLYYSASKDGIRYIILASPYPTATPEVGGLAFDVTAEQLTWLDEQLYDAEKSNQITFVMTHVPLKNHIPNDSDGLASTSKIVDILNKHKNVIVSTGHTHSNLTFDEDWYVFPGMKNNNTYTHINNGCVVWTMKAPGTYDTSVTNSQYEKGYSIGQYLEIYDDKVIIKAKQFDDTTKYVATGVYMVELEGAGATVGEASMTYGELGLGATVTALYDGAAPTATQNVEWFVNGVKIGEGATITITDTGVDLADRKLAVRITNEDGTYASAVSDDRFGGYTITYDLNGGTGVKALTDSATIGAVYKPYSITNIPKKTGFYFVGWGFSADATVPVTSFMPTGDVTLYAIYTDEPKFYFDASTGGFDANSLIINTRIEDGVLHYTSDPNASSADVYFTLSGASITAADYPIMRLKAGYVGVAGPDVTYFGGTHTTETKYGVAPISIGSGKKAEADGMNIYEVDITQDSGAKDYWQGTVTKVRYDMFQSLGASGMTDYLVFTDKFGIFKADFTTDGTNVTASAQSVNFTIVSANVSEAATTITLKPNDGYEFTTKEDMLYLFSIDGEKFDTASIDAKGNAILTKLPTVTFGFGEAANHTYTAKVSGGDKAGVVVAAIYTNGQMTDVKMVSVANANVNVVVTTETQAVVKVFVFDDMDSLKPLGAVQTATKA